MVTMASTKVDYEHDKLWVPLPKTATARRITELADDIARARRSIDGNLAKIDRSLAELARLTFGENVPSCGSERTVR